MWTTVAVLIMLVLIQLKHYWQHQQISALLMAIGIGLLVVYEIIRRHRNARNGKAQVPNAQGLPGPVWLNVAGFIAVTLIAVGFGMELMSPLNDG